MADPTPPPGFVPEGVSLTPSPPPGFVPEEEPGLLESFGRGAVEGATFGFDDKLGLSKSRRELSKETNPWTHFAGEVTGALGPMVAASFLPGGQAPAAVQGAGLLARGAQLARAGSGLARSALTAGEMGTLGRATGQSIKLGATYGGLSGAGHADVGPEDSTLEALGKRAIGAGTGAVTGGTAGAVLGPLGYGFYRGAQALGNRAANAAAETAGSGKGALVTATRKLEADRITPQQLIDQIKSEFPDDTTAAGGLAKRFWGNAKGTGRQPITSEQVEETVRRAMAGESASEISQALRAAGNGQGPGPDAVKTLLDELANRHLGPLNIVDRASMARTGAGDNTQMTMRAAAATPGEHVGIAREALLERQIGAGGRLGQLFDRMLGSSDYAGVAGKHAAELEDAGIRAYGLATANEKPFDLNPVINKWLGQTQSRRGPVPEAIQKAIDSVYSKVPVRNQETGAIVTNELRPPQTLEDFINARQNVRALLDNEKPGGAVFRELTKFYNDLTDTVAKSNPDWAVANSMWREGNAAREAMEAGARMTTRLNASSRENLAEFTAAEQMGKEGVKALRDATKALKANPQDPSALARQESAQAKISASNSRQELFKVGLVRALNDMLANQGETHNLTRQLLLPGAQKMIRQVLRKDADQFFKVLQAEKSMHRTYSSQFGSQTTPLRESIDELNWAPTFDASLMNPMHWPGKVADLVSQYAARNINAARNKDLMGIYTETDPLRQLEILRAMQGIHAARSAAGNAVGRPVISSSGPLSDLLPSLPSESPSAKPRK